MIVRHRRLMFLLFSGLLSACGGSNGGSGTKASTTTSQASTYALNEATIASTHAALTSGKFTCADLVQSYLDRIAKYDASVSSGLPLNSIVSLNPHALEDAAALDVAYQQHGKVGPLHCVPMLLKDNFDSYDFPTTAASRALAGSMPADDAFTVARLRKAGVVILGKTTMAEYAYFTQSHNSWTVRVGTPYDTSKDVGGSSSGSAAAIAANLGLIGTGSDTCASIRLPPSNASLVGVRSSIGLVSQDGIVPLSHFHDVGGPITRTVEDAARVLDVMAGIDPADPFTLESGRHQPTTYTAYLKKDGLRGKRIGVLRSYGSTDAFGDDPHVTRVMAQAIKDIEAAGAIIIDPVDLKDFRSLSVLIQEFESNINEYLATVPQPVRHNLDEIISSGQVHPVIQALLVLSKAASDTTSDSYFATKARREPLRQYVESEMDRLGLDALVYPPVLEPPMGTLVEVDAVGLAQDFASHPEGMFNGNVAGATQGSNCGFSSSTGMPSIVVPGGFTTDAKPLPIGVEFFGRKWDEGRLFEIAYAYEQATHHRVPPPGYD